MRRHAHSIALPFLAVCVIALTGCADPVPDDYVPEVVIEGFLIAGEPISHLRIYQSQPINDTFSMSKAVIKNANVLLLENGVAIPVQYVADTNGGMYLPSDTAFRVKYNCKYDITVQAIGKTVTAVATTPSSFSWLTPPRDTMLYPGEANELKPVDSLGISWTGQPGIQRYIIGVRCLDTLQYGIYLDPPTDELNRRVRESDFEEGTRIANEPTRYGFSLSSNTPVVWLAFKWFGKQELSVYAGDEAFQEWFTLVAFGQRSQYDYTLSNVHGGLGVFAGAARIKAPIFMVKDK